jgi:hypothetical protein
MANKYAQEADEINRALRQVYGLLGNDARIGSHKQEAEELRVKIDGMLKTINTNIQELADIEEKDFYGTDPTFAGRRRRLITDTEGIKTDFEIYVFPELEKLTKQLIEETKANPAAQVNEGVLELNPAGERWTVQKVLDSAGQFVDQAARAGEIAAKGYALAKALGLVFGIVIP